MCIHWIREPEMRAHLEPVRRERVHVHHVQPAGEALVERLEGVAETVQAVHVCVECLCLVDELGEDGFYETESVGGIGVLF